MSIRSIVARAQTLVSITGVFAGFVSASCSATSRMPDATVVDRGGLPCFSIPEENRVSGVTRMYSLQVTERGSADWKTLPVQLWGFEVDPPGAWIDATLVPCIAYGQVPATAVGRHAPAPLQLHHVYVVFIGARSESATTSVVGYRAEFCLISRGSGARSAVVTVPWDDKTMRWRYEVCEPR